MSYYQTVTKDLATSPPKFEVSSTLHWSVQMLLDSFKQCLLDNVKSMIVKLENNSSNAFVTESITEVCGTCST